MNLKLMMWIGTGTVVCVMGKVGWDSAQATKATRAEREALERHATQLETRIAKWEKQRAESEQTMPAHETSTPRVTSAPRESAVPSREKTVRSAPATTSPATLSLPSDRTGEKKADELQVQRLHAEMRTADLANTYGPFFAARKLSEDQRARLVQALLRYEIHLAEITAVQQAQQLPPRDPAVLGQQQQAAVQLQAETSAILGAEDQVRFQEFERSLPARRYVSAFAGVAAFSDLAFTPDQAEQLTAVLAEATAGYRNGGKANLNNSSIDWDAVDAKARQILTSEQMTFFARADVADAGARRSKDFTFALYQRLYPSGRNLSQR